MKDKKCLLVDFRKAGFKDTWQEQSDQHNFATTVAYANSAKEAESLLGAGEILTIVIFAQEYIPEINKVLAAFQKNVGCINEFQAIVCNDPHPKLLAAVFEFGVEQFCRENEWTTMAASMSRKAVASISDPDSALAKIVGLVRSIRRGKHESIIMAQDALGNLKEFDFRAAFTNGIAAEALGDYRSAIQNFKLAHSLNSKFNSAASCEAEILLLMGQNDKALALLKKIEAQNPPNINRMAALATAYSENGKVGKAAEYVKKASSAEPKNSKVLEAEAQILITAGKIDEAFKLIDQMSDVGPYFAQKLNELGIRLSKAGKAGSALEVYKKAHNVVREDLKHKITLNAALAYRRLKSYDMALKYLQRAELECGDSLDRLNKIRQTILAEREKHTLELKNMATNIESKNLVDRDAKKVS